MVSGTWAEAADASTSHAIAGPASRGPILWMFMGALLRERAALSSQYPTRAAVSAERRDDLVGEDTQRAAHLLHREQAARVELCDDAAQPEVVAQAAEPL